MAGWLTPDSIPVTGQTCHRLFIPGNRDIQACVMGCLSELIFAYNWQQYGTVTPDEMAQAMTSLYDRAQDEVWSMVGAIVPCVTASTPVGTLECDGATYNGADYPELYAVIDDTWKRSGDTFVVPDLGGRVALGASVTYAQGSTGGEKEHTLTSAEMPAHTHTTGNSFTGAAVMPGEGPVLIPNPIPADTGSAGGGGAHNNLPPYVALRYVLIAR